MTIKIENQVDDEFFDIVQSLDYSPAELKSKSRQYDIDHLHCTIKSIDENGMLVGRMALFENAFMKIDNQSAMVIGLFECVDDIKIAQGMFQKAASIAMDKGIRKLIGPINGSTWYNYRLPEKNEPMFFSDEAYKDYYTQLFLDCGFTTLATYYTAIDRPMIDRLDSDAITSIHMKHGLHIREIDVNNFDEELRRIYELSIIAFKNNYLYSPISYHSFLQKYQPLRFIMDPRFVLIAEDDRGNLVGFVFCIHDHCNVHERSLIVKTMARLPGTEWAGLGRILSSHLLHRAKSEGYTSMIHAFMHSDNASHSISSKQIASHIKKYHLYEKEI
jgi:L-amino acid N-acyltransferase YncA